MVAGTSFQSTQRLISCNNLKKKTIQIMLTYFFLRMATIRIFIFLTDKTVHHIQSKYKNSTTITAQNSCARNSNVKLLKNSNESKLQGDYKTDYYQTVILADIII